MTGTSRQNGPLAQVPAGRSSPVTPTGDLHLVQSWIQMVTSMSSTHFDAADTTYTWGTNALAYNQCTEHDYPKAEQTVMRRVKGLSCCALSFRASSAQGWQPHSEAVLNCTSQ